MSNCCDRRSSPEQQQLLRGSRNPTNPLPLPSQNAPRRCGTRGRRSPWPPGAGRPRRGTRAPWSAGGSGAAARRPRPPHSRARPACGLHCQCAPESPCVLGAYPAHVSPFAAPALTGHPSPAPQCRAINARRLTAQTCLGDAAGVIVEHNFRSLTTFQQLHCEQGQGCYGTPGRQDFQTFLALP